MPLLAERVTGKYLADWTTGRNAVNASNTFTYIAALIFALMGIVHVIRLFTHFQIDVGTHSIPMWVSYVAIVITFGLGWMLCREARGRSTT